MRTVNGAIEIGPAVNITNSPGYDNQPSFTPDGSGRAVHVGPRCGRRHADRHLSLRHRRAADRAGDDTPESEYSPTVTPAGRSLGDPRRARRGEDAAALAVHRRRARSASGARRTSSRWGTTRGPTTSTLALFVLGQPRDAAARRHAHRHRGHARLRHRPIDPADPGPAAARVRRSASSSASATARRRRVSSIKELNPVDAGDLGADARRGRAAPRPIRAWTPDGTLLMVKGAVALQLAARPIGMEGSRCRSNG